MSDYNIKENFHPEIAFIGIDAKTYPDLINQMLHDNIYFEHLPENHRIQLNYHDGLYRRDGVIISQDEYMKLFDEYICYDANIDENESVTYYAVPKYDIKKNHIYLFTMNTLNPQVIMKLSRMNLHIFRYYILLKFNYNRALVFCEGDKQKAVEMIRKQNTESLGFSSENVWCLNIGYLNTWKYPTYRNIYENIIEPKLFNISSSDKVKIDNDARLFLQNLIMKLDEELYCKGEKKNEET